MINEQDQQLLLNLFLASIIYVNVKTEPVNPFVKSLGKSNEEKAFDVLLNAVNNLEHLTPLLSEIEGLVKEDDASVNVEDKEVNLDEYL